MIYTYNENILSRISNTNDVANNCHVGIKPIFISSYKIYFRKFFFFIRNLKLQNNKISVSIVKKLY